MGKPRSTEKQILFNTQMVQAILDGKKTTTRRIIKRTPSNDCPSGYGFWKEFNDSDKRFYIKDYTHSPLWWTQEEYIKKFSRYQVGDTLYVREKFFKGDILNSNEDIVDRDIVLYAADELREDLDPAEMKWKPSIHMPKKLARIFLKVLDIGIERLSTMEHEDFLSEGIREYTKDNEVLKYAVKNQYTWKDMPRNSKDPFVSLWDSTLTKEQIEMYSWAADPWVWVIKFEIISENTEIKI